MQRRRTFEEISDKYIIGLIVAASFGVAQINVAGFPVYEFLLLLIASAWMTAKILFVRRVGSAFLQIRNPTDVLTLVATVYALLSIVGKLFQNPKEGAIDIAGNTLILAFSFLYFLLSAGRKFRSIYFDLFLYCGLFIAGIFLFPYFTGVQMTMLSGTMFTDSGASASFLLLLCMAGSYQYCYCRDKMRSWFYLLVSAVGLFSLLLNHNILSLWFMSAFFLAIPVFFRPTAALVKKSAQLFFLYGFMLSNMSLLTGYTDIFQKEVSYSLENSVYLELLLAFGGIFFFHYWEKIPEGVDLERLVMRRMRRAYLFAGKGFAILFCGILIGGERWGELADTMTGRIWKSFALPLVSSVRGDTGWFYECFRGPGAAAVIFAVIFSIFLIDRIRKHFCFDRPVTGMLGLLSGFFLIQLFFWKPAPGTLTLYFVLFILAAFSKEEKMKVTSIKIRQETLLARYAVQDTAQTEK